MQANYTWSKSLTNASGSQTSGDETNRNPKAVNPFDPRTRYCKELSIQRRTTHFQCRGSVGSSLWQGTDGGCRTRWPSGSWVAGRFLLPDNTQAGHWCCSTLLTLILREQGISSTDARKSILQGSPSGPGVNRGDLDPRDTTSDGFLTQGCLFSIPGTYRASGQRRYYVNEMRDPNIYQ